MFLMGLGVLGTAGLGVWIVGPRRGTTRTQRLVAGLYGVARLSVAAAVGLDAGVARFREEHKRLAEGWGPQR